MKKPLKHVFDYLILSFLVSAGILLTLIFSGNPVFQRIVVIGLSVSYIIWGIIHHKKEGTYSNEIGIEYLLYAALGSMIVIGLL